MGNHGISSMHSSRTGNSTDRVGERDGTAEGQETGAGSAATACREEQLVWTGEKSAVIRSNTRGDTRATCSAKDKESGVEEQMCSLRNRQSLTCSLRPFALCE